MARKFDGEAGTRPNTDVWEMETGNDGWGNNQLEYNTNRSDNAQLTGTGELKIIAKMEEYGGEFLYFGTNQNKRCL